MRKMIISSEEYSIIDSKDEISSQEYGEFLQTVFNDTYSKIDEFKKISVHIVFKVGNTFGDLNARADENAEPYVEIEKDFLRAVHKFYGTMANSSNRKFYEVIFPEIFDAKLVEKYTTYMQILTIRVLLIHELGHIYNGHLLEMMGKNANLSINEDERDYIEEDDMEIIKWQAKEWDADRFCAYHIVPFQFRMEEKIFLSKFGLESIYSKDIYMLRAIIFSVLVTLFILGAGRVDTTGKSYKEKHHLPERFRGYCYMDDIVKEYNYICGTELALKKEEKIDIIYAFEKWIDEYMRQVCKLLNWDVENNVEIFDDEHMEYYKKVEMYKDTELKNLLLNTNRCGLAELQERYVDFYEVMSRISDRDGGEFYVY